VGESGLALTLVLFGECEASAGLVRLNQYAYDVVESAGRSSPGSSERGGGV